MARIKKKSNTIRMNICKNYLVAILQIVISVFVAYFFIKIWKYGWFMMIAIIFLDIILLRRKMDTIHSLKGGLQGEKKVMKLLKQLPKNYFIIANKKLTFKDKKQEYDFVVICPTEIIIIEVKNYSGKLSGDIENHYLTQSYPHNNRASKQVKNPIKQVIRQKDLLHQYLLSQHINCPITGYVYFLNPQLEIKLNKGDHCIIQSKDLLLEKILKSKKKKLINSKKIFKILWNGINY